MPQLTAKNDPTAFPKSWRYFASFWILFHLGTVILVAAVNHFRSDLQDSVLTWLQPYTLGLNLGHEGMNAELVSDSSKLDEYRISIELADPAIGSNEPWQPVIEYAGTKTDFCIDRPKQRQLLALLQTLARGDDSEGVIRVLKGIVVHYESRSNQKVKRVRLELPRIEQDSLILDSALQVMDGKTCLVASVARFDNGEIGLVGSVPAHRSVPSKTKRSSS